MKTVSNSSSRILRTALEPQKYQFICQYIRGETNIADTLSRPTETKESKYDTARRFIGEEKQQIMQSYHLALKQGSIAKMKFLIRQRY